tara:strand:- start:8246 stop:11302 length:3057 start_codon:yes stop_codon:yes gene_type:complete
MQLNYNKLNNILGWTVFAIATVTYLLTIEPTASFWDCGEYISTAVKLQVGHPPGAPFFQLMGNFFAQFAFGDVMKQAAAVNALSALSSSFTILFLFWTITALGRKFASKYGEINTARTISILFSGLVGSLAYTFSDSFWFSATEGEVYAMSSLFTAIAFWAILKWEVEVTKSPRAGRWIIFIAYMTGLSIGVHILVFLTIPAIVMIYFFKKDPEINNRKFIIYNGIAMIVLGVIFAGIIPIVLKTFGKMEILMVNTFGMPFNSGTIFTVILLAVLSFIGLKYTRKKELPLWNTLILSTIFIILGYSTFITLAIRSNANTPIDENNPEDALSLLDYYNRVQYGDWPVAYGQYYNAPVVDYDDGKPVYTKDEEAGKYVVSDDKKKSVLKYAKTHQGFFPRIWSTDHAQGYESIMGYSKNNNGKRPSFGENIRFFFSYQIGGMYWRYFMWNFAGRQNDYQFRGEATKGNWISGINFIDEARLGPQDNLPFHAKNSPARNKYYLLPFLLGLIGLYFHFKKSGKDAWALTLFFLATGIGVLIYTNVRPYEPRERDYSFVGSFYVYAIWIGLGVHAIFEMLKDKMQNEKTSIAIGALCLLLVPGIMAKENWDDHDRSNRYLARDIARAYLDSCEPDAILFTNGDNDTFPLWYVQEIEGYRTDVRIINLSLLNTDWYIDQAKRAAYDAAPVPFSFEHDQYRQGTRDVIYFQDRGFKGRWRVEDLIKWIKSDDPETKFTPPNAKTLNIFPKKQVRVSIDKEKVLAEGVVSLKDSAKIVDYIDWNLKTNALSKRDLMVIDLIANNDWTRPIYFSVTVGNNSKAYFWLDEYFQLEGLAYRFVPIRNKRKPQTIDFGVVNADKMYDNMMNRFSYGNMELPDVYLDETNKRVSYNLRNSFGRLADQLVAEGKNDKALEVLNRCEELMPESKFAYNYFVFGVIEGYFKAGDTAKGMEMINLFADRLDEELTYYRQFKGQDKKLINLDIRTAVQYYQQLVRMVQMNTDGGADPNNLEQADIFKRYQSATTGI